jgi:hypothetical protein
MIHNGYKPNEMIILSSDKKVWQLYDGTQVSSAGLKRMFMGKILNPAQRKLLGILKIK